MRHLLWMGMPLLCALPLVADALPQRTFVASNGADTNSCALTAPCRSFGTAVAAVAAGGEVIVLDSAGYGATTIAKSVSIISPPGIYAGVSVFSGAGITVNGASIKVVLRGLSINNQGGTDGIDFLQGGGLNIENCVISGFSTGIGIDLQAASSVMHINDTTIRDGGQGIRVLAASAVTVSRTRVEDNAIYGVFVVGSAILGIEDSVVSGSGDTQVYVFPAPGAISKVTIARTLISGGNFGVVASSALSNSAAEVSVMDSTIADTATSGGIFAHGGSGFVANVLSLRNQILSNGMGLHASGANAVLTIDGNGISGNFIAIQRDDPAIMNTRNNNTVGQNSNPPQGLPYTVLTNY